MTLATFFLPRPRSGGSGRTLSQAEEVDRAEHDDKADDDRQSHEKGWWPRRVVQRSLIIAADITGPGEGFGALADHTLVLVIGFPTLAAIAHHAITLLRRRPSQSVA